MRTAAEITGEAAVAENIVKVLRADNSSICTLVGPAGSGKTNTADQIIDELNESFAATIWRGNVLTASTPEAVLASNQSKGSEGRFKGAALDFAEDFGNLLLEGHIPFSKTFRNIIGWRPKSAKQRALTVARQNFLYSVASSGKKQKCPLVVCDNFHHWDDPSINFLAQAAAGLWNDVYPALGKARYLLVWTPEEAKPGFMALIKRRFGRDILVHKLSHVSRTEFKELLVAFGARDDLAADIYDSIYAVSQGHLAFAAQISALLTKESLEVLPVASWRDLDRSLFEVLRKRLDEVPDHSDSVATLAEAISAIGEVLRIDDLICIFKDAEIPLHQTLQRAAELGLLQEIHRSVRISHEVIQAVITKNMSSDQRAWHLKYAECLRDLRPADYERRALHYLKGGQLELAETMRVHALLMRTRQRAVQPGDGWARTAEVIGKAAVHFLDQLEEAAKLQSSRRYTEAIAVLHAAIPQKPVVGEPQSLLAERDVLLARLYLILRDDRSRAFALELCEQWEHLSTEGELWARIMETRLVALSDLRRHEEGRGIERQLLARYQERKRYDPDAAFAEGRLKRKAEAIHSPQIANRMLREALDFFDSDGTGEAPRDAVEYLITLNNFGANELILCRYDSALRQFKKAVAIVERTRPELVAHSELVLSNLVVAHFVSTGKISPIVTEIQNITSDLSVRHSDVALLHSNLACLAAYSGEIDQGYRSLKKVSQTISGIDGFSRYSIYFVNSNYAVMESLLGLKEEAAAILRNVMPIIASLPIDMQPYAVRRTKILLQLIESSGDLSVAVLDRALQTGRPEVGESWPFYGRALALTDLQFWMES